MIFLPTVIIFVILSALLLSANRFSYHQEDFTVNSIKRSTTPLPNLMFSKFKPLVYFHDGLIPKRIRLPIIEGTYELLIKKQFRK